MLSYWTPSVLKRNLPIYNSLKKYGHNNFVLAILEDLGPTGSVEKNIVLAREQYYLDMLFKKEGGRIELLLNNTPSAGTTALWALGYKHSAKFKLNRTGLLNPMYGKIFSPEFVEMQTRNKAGINNPQAPFAFGSLREGSGVKKSTNTIAKLTKLVYRACAPYDNLRPYGRKI